MLRSVPALEDLRQCLERTQQQDELVRSFRDSLQSRLLQPGANTSAILEIYVSIIKVQKRCVVGDDLTAGSWAIEKEREREREGC